MLPRAGRYTVIPRAHGGLVSQLDPVALPTSDAPVLNIANVLTLLRFLLVPVFAWFLLTDSGHDRTWRVGRF